MKRTKKYAALLAVMIAGSVVYGTAPAKAAGVDIDLDNVEIIFRDGRYHEQRRDVPPPPPPPPPHHGPRGHMPPPPPQHDRRDFGPHGHMPPPPPPHHGPRGHMPPPPPRR